MKHLKRLWDEGHTESVPFRLCNQTFTAGLQQNKPKYVIRRWIYDKLKDDSGSLVNCFHLKHHTDIKGEKKVPTEPKGMPIFKT